MKCDHKHDAKNVYEKTCIERVPIFSSLNLEEMLEVARITLSRKYKKGETIYLEGEMVERLFVIHKGKVKISKISETGKEQIIRILGPGDFMGELSLFTHSPIKSNAEALEPTTVCVIDGDKINDIIQNHPGIALKIIRELSLRLEKAENLIESLGLQGVEQRVADILLEMAGDKNVVDLSISKKDLASYIGMTQETLSRKLSFFQSMGWIKQEGQRRIVILDRESLENIGTSNDFI